VSYHLAPALVALRDEVNKRFPKRDKRSDGWIGDASHAARKSSHNPDYANGGAVRGLDIDIDDNDAGANLAQMVLDAAIGDHRVWYVIHKGKIWSRTHGWKARVYKGNPHTGHVHISLVENPRVWADKSRWLTAPKLWHWNPSVVSDLPLIQEQFHIEQGAVKSKRKRYHGVAAIQNALNVKYLKKGQKLTVDGWVGPATLKAWRSFESSHKGTGWKGTPDMVSLRELQIAYRFKE
jgi:hypothetical protein